MRLTTEQYDTLAAIIGRREWGLAQTGMERATLVLDDCTRVGINASTVTPAQLSLAMSSMPLNAQDICNYADMGCALAAVLPSAQVVNADLLTDQRAAFGAHWCGLEARREGEWTLCALYPAQGDGQSVEVHCNATPAKFYQLRVQAGPDSGISPAYSLCTASGGHRIAAEVAQAISSGMLGLIEARS
jgi:hypothetical protein